MNIDLRICNIKNNLRYKIVSLDYFKNCFELLIRLLKTNNNNASLDFATVLKETSVELNNQDERREYYKYYTKILLIISELERKIKVENIKIR